jgi:hypothetical protein
MTEIVRLLADRRVGFATVERQASRGYAHKACDYAQQGGFARPISAGNDHRLAAAQAEIEALKYAASAAVAGQFIGSELHHVRRHPEGAGEPADQVPKNLDFLSISGDVPWSIWRLTRKDLISPD